MTDYQNDTYAADADAHEAEAMLPINVDGCDVRV